MKKPTDQEELKIAKKIGATVKALRQARKWSQSELAEKAGISDYKVVGFVEQAATFPSLRTLSRLAKALKVSVSKLTEGV
jgi:transcriptional regulator with XRE-family HTH domain